MGNCKTNYYRCGQEILLAFRVVVPESGEEGLDAFLARITGEIKNYADRLAEQLTGEHKVVLAAGNRWVRRELWEKAEVEQMKDDSWRVRVETSYGQIHAPAQVSGCCEFEWNTTSNLCVKRVG